MIVEKNWHTIEEEKDDKFGRSNRIMIIILFSSFALTVQASDGLASHNRYAIANITVNVS